MPSEPIRECGFRKCGGLYLVGNGITTSCDRLPYNLPDLCPACGCGIKQHRGFQWINPQLVFGEHQNPETSTNHYCNDEPTCEMCNPTSNPAGLMWVGNRYYSAKSFINESIKQGISKRIAHIPTNFILGETIVYLAHPSGGLKETEERNVLMGIIKKKEPCTAIFYVFKPVRIEKLIWKREASAEIILELEKQNITPIIIPDDDIAHDQATTLTKDIKDGKKPKYKNLSEVF